ncbi:MAG: T9SS type A sorting domain-containing protein [Lentimicrobium sp.]|nr:T9SS type A sorting domain-containing protein [Lentimicrobium sp.]
MKKTQISLIALFCCITLATIAQIPNAGFENWTLGNPDGWASSNVPEAGLINIFQTTDKHSGELALRGDVVSFFTTPMGPVIQSGPDATGFPVSERYHFFELYYKFTSVGGDKFSVNVALEKDGSPIAQGAVALPATVSSYTWLSVPMAYTTDEVPDLAIIQLSITGPVTGPDVHVGSVMYIDDLLFSFTTGNANIPLPDLGGKCYPNPSSDIVYIPIKDNISGDVVLNVFDIKGNGVGSLTGHRQAAGNNLFEFSVNHLAPGLYFYSIEGVRTQNHGKFSVSR